MLTTHLQLKISKNIYTKLAHILAPPIRHLTSHIFRDRIPARHRTAVSTSTYLIARLVRLGRPRAHRRSP